MAVTGDRRVASAEPQQLLEATAKPPSHFPIYYHTYSHSMSSPDPLELLLRSIAASEPIVLLTAASEPTQSLPSATYISFLDPSAPDSPILLAKDAPTRYTSRSDSRADFYTVGQLWLAWTERETGVREYLMKGQEAGGGGYVGIADRRAVIDYLEGKSEGGGRVVSKREANGALLQQGRAA
jgi:parafibromin